MRQAATIEVEEKSGIYHSQSFSIGPFKFRGPFFSYLECRDEAGILAILELHEDGRQEVLNVYQSANVRGSAWLELAYHAESDTATAVAVFYTNNLSAQISTNIAASILSCTA